MPRFNPDHDEEFDTAGYEGPEHVEGVCKACGKPCTSVTIDVGIGTYEYWGAPGNDVRLVEASPCCEDEVEPKADEGVCLACGNTLPNCECDPSADQLL